MTVEQYIKGLVGVSVPDEAASVILRRRNIVSGASTDSLTLEQQELIRADVYSYCLTIPSTASQVEDADGGWKHKEGGAILSEGDKKRFERIATAIYRRYGEEILSSESKITIVKL